VSSLALAYLSSQSSTAPASLLENAPAIETDASETPAPSEDLPISDTPELEAAGEAELDIPELEDEEPTGDQE
jgi:hypothetical protein